MGFGPTSAISGINLNRGLHDRRSAGNVAGGLRQGFDYAHQIGLQLDVDWEKLADIPGFSNHMVVVNRAGCNLSSDWETSVWDLIWRCTMSGFTAKRSCLTAA